MNFDIIDETTNIETIAKGSGIRELNRLRKLYGLGNWKKMKGISHIRLSSGKVKLAELHWYEAHGIGKKEMKESKQELPEFVVCVNNSDYPASLELHKIYRAIDQVALVATKEQSMHSIRKDMEELDVQLRKGAIQRAYRALLSYMMGLPNTFQEQVPGIFRFCPLSMLLQRNVKSRSL